MLEDRFHPLFSEEQIAVARRRTAGLLRQEATVGEEMQENRLDLPLILSHFTRVRSLHTWHEPRTSTRF